MKNYKLLIPGLFLIFITFTTCTSNSKTDNCSNLGKLCINNKMDSTISVSIAQKHQQITIVKDYMKCLDLEANIAYTINITGAGYTKPDTTFLILPCDNKLFVVSQ